MTPNELATFLREEVPRIKRHAVEFPWKDAHREDEAALFSALDAAVGLLRKATTVLGHLVEAGRLYTNERELLATLRLVVGEKEDREC